jgi:NADH-quinone oxidoreductase subunit J
MWWDEAQNLHFSIGLPKLGFDLAIFLLFAGLILFFGNLLVRSRNPVNSVLALILCFCNAGGLLLFLNLDFFAMIFLVVYVGAIAVLFLFVVMMINIKVEEIYDNILRDRASYLPLSILIGATFLAQTITLLSTDLTIFTPFNSVAAGTFQNLDLLRVDEFSDFPELLERTTTVQALAQPLYIYFFPCFVIAGLILLVAMVSAIVLTMSREVPARSQEIYVQNLRGSKITK